MHELWRRELQSERRRFCVQRLCLRDIRVHDGRGVFLELPELLVWVLLGRGLVGVHRVCTGHVPIERRVFGLHGLRGRLLLGLGSIGLQQLRGGQVPRGRGHVKLCSVRRGVLLFGVGI